jgi:phosphoserine phosphatase RsbU/P
VSQPADNIALPAAVTRELEAADRLPEIAVVYDPVPEVLEAYAFEGRVGVIAVVSGGASDRVAALEAGALEVIHPDMAEFEACARLGAATARFRSRLLLEQTSETLARRADTTERNLQLAARLQRSFLPRTLPEIHGVSFSAAYLPQDFVSGDTYEVRVLAPGKIAVYTLDAVGHGVRAALLTTLLRSVFRPMDGATIRPPGDVLADLNQHLLDAQLEESPTAAFCYGILDCNALTLELANAGHPDPVRLSGAGGSEPIGTSGLLLGVDPTVYESSTITLAKGERVFFFTDGADPNYDHRFADQLSLHKGLSLEDQVGGALGAVIQLDAEGRPEDDVTAVAFQIERE